jgi:hypothetical protein
MVLEAVAMMGLDLPFEGSRNRSLSHACYLAGTEMEPANDKKT